MGYILLDPKLFSKATRTTNINLIGLAETGIEYIPVSWLGSSRVGFARSCTNHWTESCLPINLNNHKVGTTRKLRAKFCHYCAIFFVIDLYGDRCEYTMIQITLCWILKLDVCCVPSWHGGAFCWGLRCQSFSSIASLAAPSKSMWFIRTARTPD